MGTVIEGPADYYSSRLAKAERSDHFVDDILKDINKRHYLKRKMTDIQQSSAKVKFGAHRKGGAGGARKRTKR